MWTYYKRIILAQFSRQTSLNAKGDHAGPAMLDQGMNLILHVRLTIVCCLLCVALTMIQTIQMLFPTSNWFSSHMLKAKSNKHLLVHDTLCDKDLHQ